MNISTRDITSAFVILFHSFFIGVSLTLIPLALLSRFDTSEPYKTFAWVATFLTAFLVSLSFLIEYKLVRPGSRKWAWFDRGPETGTHFRVVRHMTLLPLSFKNEPDNVRVRKMFFVRAGTYRFSQKNMVVTFSILSSVDFFLPTETLEGPLSPRSVALFFTRNELLGWLGHHILDALTREKRLEVGRKEIEIDAGPFLSQLRKHVIDHHTGRPVLRIRIESLSNDPRQDNE